MRIGEVWQFLFDVPKPKQIWNYGKDGLVKITEIRTDPTWEDDEIEFIILSTNEEARHNWKYFIEHFKKVYHESR